MGKGGGCVPSKKRPPAVNSGEAPAIVSSPPNAESQTSEAQIVPATKLKILIVFYSMYGHVETLARRMKTGVDGVDGVEAVLYRVPETLPEDVLAQMRAPPKDDKIVEMKEVRDLESADGFLFGFPTRYGAMAGQMKAFFDSTGQLWRDQKLAGKPAGFFVSTGTQGGGQETKKKRIRHGIPNRGSFAPQFATRQCALAVNHPLNQLARDRTQDLHAMEGHERLNKEAGGHWAKTQWLARCLLNDITMSHVQLPSPPPPPSPPREHLNVLNGKAFKKKDDDIVSSPPPPPIPQPPPSSKPLPCDGFKQLQSPPREHHDSQSSATTKPPSPPHPPPSSNQVVVLEVALHCRGCERKMKKHISKIQGVTSFKIEFAAKKVTVVGDVTPLAVLTSVLKVKNAKLLAPATISSAQSGSNGSEQSSSV